MILYRKGPQLRIRRAAAPEPPFWYATAVVPYVGRRGSPVDIDFVSLRATSNDRGEVQVCHDAADELERMRVLDEPVLVEVTGSGERVFRRGEAVLEHCTSRQTAALCVVTADGALPSRQFATTVTVISTWPFDLQQLERVFLEAEARQLRWGVAIPLLYPITTDLDALAGIVRAAASHGAIFATGLPIEADPTARQALASSLALDTADDRYAMLFHADLAPLLLATERHVAALAHERGLHDFVVPPRWSERTNWNGATLLALVASRLMAMEIDLDLAGTIARSARAVAALDKPLERVAAAASLGIIETLDETSIGILSEWIETGESSFAAWVDEQWRIRRDAGA